VTSAASRDEPSRGGPSPRLPPYLRSEQHPPNTSGDADLGRATMGPAPPVGSPPPGAVRPASVPPLGPRPFVLTRGRVTDGVSDIGPETQVTASAAVLVGVDEAVDALSGELRSIVALCEQPMSVAEIAARLRLHLGVTKVLISDLQVAGHVVVHIEPATTSHSPEIILRVMHGLRSIS
jgi:hypothetical protein